MAMKQSVEYISLGGGPPSVALLILNLTKRIKNPTDVVVFADTGWEKQVTYDAVDRIESWSAEFGVSIIRTQAKFGPLQDYVRDKSVPIPVHTENAIGKRQCTERWKIEPIRQAIAAKFGKGVPMIAQLGMTVDEIHRVKPPRVKRDSNRYPLIELGMNRQACVEVIQEAGLTVPEWSACLGCPLQSAHRWRRLASEFPEDFAKAVGMDTFLRERAAAEGKGKIWLHFNKRPLGEILSTSQMPMLIGAELEPADMECPDGVCFT
jgi:hypothetical protein